MVFGLAAEPAALEHQLAVVRPTGVLGDVACDLADQLTHPSLRGVGRPHLLHQRLQILGGVLSGLHHHEDDERLDVVACANRRQALGGLAQVLVFRQELGGLIDVLLVHPDLPWRMPDDHRRGRQDARRARPRAWFYVPGVGVYRRVQPSLTYETIATL